MINRPFGAIFLENNVARPFKESSQFTKFFEVCFFGYLYISLFAWAVRININNNSHFDGIFEILLLVFVSVAAIIYGNNFRYFLYHSKILIFIIHISNSYSRRDNFIK